MKNVVDFMGIKSTDSEDEFCSKFLRLSVPPHQRSIAVSLETNSLAYVKNSFGIDTVNHNIIYNVYDSDL